jgi:hypothetical protein
MELACPELVEEVEVASQTLKVKSIENSFKNPEYESQEL